MPNSPTNPDYTGHASPVTQAAIAAYQKWWNASSATSTGLSSFAGGRYDLPQYSSTEGATWEAAWRQLERLRADIQALALRVDEAEKTDPGTPDARAEKVVEDLLMGRVMPKRVEQIFEAAGKAKRDRAVSDRFTRRGD
jgi:hypothetical protein